MTTAPSSRRFALALHRATALVDRVAESYLRPAHGIGISEFSALVTIEALGPARQTDLAAALDVTRSAVTQRLATLTRRGWADVTPDERDARAHVVTLTPAGRRLVADAWQGLARYDDGLEDGVDLVGLLVALERIAVNAERHLERRGAR